MHRLLLALALIAPTGCTTARERPALTPVPPAPVEAKADLAVEAPAAGAQADLATPSTKRMPGDFVVYRFSGSFREAPLTLTQKVVDRRGSVVTVDVSLKEGDAAREMRVKVDEGSRNDIVSVALLEGGIEKPATLDAYEALLARTIVAADQNEALLRTEDVSVYLGGVSVAAKRLTYQVRIGKKTATLRTLESADFSWGDVGGDILLPNGKVLYRAEVVDAGRDEGLARAAAR